MDSAFRALHDLDFERISGRLRALVAGAREGAHDRPWLRPLFHSLILFPLSLLLGIWANERAQVDAITQHEESHLPRLETWRAVLAAQGFVEIPPGEEDRESRRRLRSLRASGAPEGESWHSRQGRWFAVMDSVGTPLLFEKNDACRERRLFQSPAPEKGGRRKAARGRKAVPELMVHRGPGTTEASSADEPWDPVGRGWQAMEELLSRNESARGRKSPCERLKSAENPVPQAQSPSVERRDPRELRF